MNKSTQIVAVVVLVIAIALVAFFYAPKSSVTALDSKVDSLSTNMEAYYADVDLKIGSVETRVTNVEFENDTLRALAERNARCVQKLYNEVVTLGERLTETRNLAVTHGKKINDLSETVFKAAFGTAWADTGKAVWDKYVLCGNQEYWDDVVKRLSPEQMQKILQVDKLNQRIAKLEKPNQTP